MKAINYMDKVLRDNGYEKKNDYIYQCKDYVQIISYKDNYTKSDWITIRCYDKNVDSYDFYEYALNKSSNVELKIIFKQFGII